MPDTGFDPLQIVATLHRHRVRYVVIGGVAARLHGSPLLTEDIDAVPAMDDENLSRLAAALRDLDARLAVEGVEGGIAVPLDAHTFTSPVMGFDTSAGAVDVAHEAIGRGGFPVLAPRAVTFEIAGARVLVAALDDVIASKEAAGRPKDRAHLEVLYELRDELQRRATER